jgi:tetratricopeptide (TPR) repeat protein
MLPLFVFSADVAARRNETTNWTDQDFALYPPFCRARIEREPKELVDFWTQRLGPKNYLHIHHFCFGLKALNLAYANLNNKQQREFMASAVIGNFNYIIEHTERTFYMRPEAYVNLGRGYVLRQEYDVARQKFHEALKLNPKLVDAWVAMSDMYHQLGKKSDALSILEQASEICGENKKIDLRVAEMRSAGIKPSAGTIVPVQKPAAARASESGAAASAEAEKAPDAAASAE